MQHDTTTSTGGVDWATDTNEQCVIAADGAVLLRANTTHDAAGIRRLVSAFLEHGVDRVAIERPDGPVVEALIAAGVEVVVVTPRQVKNLRDRYGAAGNKDDRFDAYVLADVLRTDSHRLVCLTPDSAQTLALRSAVRARTDLVEARVAICNQLRAHLRTVFPAAVGLFADLDSAVSLAFLSRFPNVDKAAWLSHKRLGSWLAKHGYSGRTPTQTLLDRLDAGPEGLTGQVAAAAAHTTLAYVKTLQALRTQISALETQIREQLAGHPDAAIFTSLPRSGQVRAAKLLVEIGDARGRFPTDASLAALAGAAPSTRQSGRHHVVSFRWACDHKLRDAVTDFAADSRHASPWAAAIYDRHRAAGKTHQHATRILARAWLRIIWRCWQDHTAYDPTRHGGNQPFLPPSQELPAVA
ncbi:IS110 family transposase [Egibacter rhizosphaerae]|uniref:IS110 family transposase n=1 Tax=Egibacter rhizosphaerae TaxID=1670831 RepID=A0A411YHP5_9ACTN|nr:IS110 family transposase [Egibacter rhizosphaerae]QBI20626.1 IS110 family transposase [Egibacter rhizosphaerae]